MNQFVVNRLRSKPITYTVTISHFVVDSEWMMSVQVADLTEDDENKSRIAGDLRHAADMLEKEPTP